MTAFNPADLPSAINTYEKLFAYAALALRFCNPVIGTVEAQDVTQRTVQIGHFDAADNTRRLLIRVTLPMDPGYDSDSSKKLWAWAQEISSNAVAATFKSN